MEWLFFLNIENPKDINFKEELRELEYSLKNITEKQIKIVDYWSDKALIESIMSIALKLVSEYDKSPGMTVRLLSILTKAINDAYIIASYFKYFWDYPRPIQLKEKITTRL